MKGDRFKKIFSLPVILAVIFIAVLLLIEHGKTVRLTARGTDSKPAIDFTWTPIGRVSLTDMVGHLRVEDDYALDFSTLKIEIVELNRTLEVTRSDVIGKSFEQTMSFAMFAHEAELLKRGQMTLRISVADDRGQMSEIERVVKLKVPEGTIFLNPMQVLN